MEFKREDLNSYSVYSLRELARNVGVKSPTNKKKEELIDAILKINNKEVEPEFNSSKVGRPPIGHERAFVPYSTLPDPQGIYILNAAEINSYGLPSNDDKGAFDAEGVLEITNYGYGIIRPTYVSDKIIFISKMLIAEHKLKIGDHVLGRVKLSTNNESLVMISVIKSYNYELGIIREWFRDFTPGLKDKQLELPEIKNINVGTNAFIKCNNKAKQFEVANNLYSYVNKIGLATVFINFNTLDNSQCKLSTKVDINFSEKEENKVRAVILAIEHAKRLVENKQDVVLIFSGISEYLRVLDNVNKNQVGGTVLIKSVDKMKEIAGIAKSFENSSLTTVFVDSLSVPERYIEVVQYDIIKNMHKYVEL